MRSQFRKYRDEESVHGKSKGDIKESIKRVLGFTGKANFNHKTWDVIKQHICLRVVANRTKLRFNQKKRNSLFFIKGQEALDKEMDISYIIRQVRILRYFLKTVLDQDQYCLLKLKSTDLIPSSDDENNPPLDIARKKYKKDAILDRLIDQLQRKPLSKTDNRLLEVLGMKETLKLIVESKKKVD